MTPLSIAHIPPGSPAWVTTAVWAALALHIGGGTLGIVSGYAAAFVRKGEPLHRAFGSVFFLSMLTMAAMGALLSFWINQLGNLAGAALSFYLVATAWLTVIRGERRIAAFEYFALAFALATAVTLLTWGALATASPKGAFGGYPAALYYVFGSFAVFLAGLDLKVIRQGGTAGVQRIARHLWRMCFALFFASASFFLGQQKVMPAFMHGSPILTILGVAPLGLMVLWLVRVREPRRFRNMAATAAS